MLKVLLTIALSISVWAYSYNPFLLNVQANLYPKLLLLDMDIKQKSRAGKVILGIVYDDGDLPNALYVKELIEKRYGDKLNGYKLKLIPVEALQLLDLKKIDIPYLYILKVDEEHMKKLAQIAKKNGIVTFTYDKSDLKYGFLFSVDLEKEPVIHLNKKALTKKYNFYSTLYQIVRIEEGA